MNYFNDIIRPVQVRLATRELLPSQHQTLRGNFRLPKHQTLCMRPVDCQHSKHCSWTSGFLNTKHCAWPVDCQHTKHCPWTSGFLNTLLKVFLNTKHCAWTLSFSNTKHWAWTPSFSNTKHCAWTLSFSNTKHCSYPILYSLPPNHHTPRVIIQMCQT